MDRPVSRWRQSPAYARVFMDGTEYGSIDELERMEFIDARDATTRHGTGYTGGIIHLHTMDR